MRFVVNRLTDDMRCEDMFFVFSVDEDEDFLGSSLIKISKKELNDLVTELFNVMPATDEELTLENLANSVLTDTSQTEVRVYTPPYLQSPHNM